jgi:signal transduction histidine kinase
MAIVGGSFGSRHPVQLERVLLVCIPAIITTIVLYGFYFYLWGAWQLLAVAGGDFLALASLGLGLILERRQKREAAAQALLFSLLAVLGVVPLFVEGLTAYIVLSAGLLIVIVGAEILPGRWRTWLAAAAVFGLYAWLVDRLAPLPRYASGPPGLRGLYLLGASAAFLGLILWHSMLVALRAFTSIHTRLIITSLLLVAFTGGALSYFSTIVLMHEEQDQAVGRLNALATHKAHQIEDWANRMQMGLAMFVLSTKPQLSVVLAPEAHEQAGYRDARQHLQMDLSDTLIQSRLYDELYVLDADGSLILSTGGVDGLSPPAAECIQRALTGACVQPPRYYDALGQVAIVAAGSVVDQQGRAVGVVAGYAGLEALNKIVAESDGLGETGVAYLIGADHTILTLAQPLRASPSVQNIADQSQGARIAVAAHVSGSGFYEDDRGVPVVGVYRWLPKLQVALVAEQDQAEAFQPSRRLINVHLVVALILLVTAATTALSMVRSITAPLSQLTATAHQIAGGTLDLTADVKQDDEIGALARTFNHMTARLRQSHDQLEQRTEELARANADLRAENAVRRQAEQEILQHNRELAILSRRLVEIQESERHYISRELHDETGQALTSLMLRLGMLERDLQRGMPVADRVAELKHTLEEVLEGLHGLAMDLRPSSLDHVGLVPALRQHAERVTERYGLTVDFGAIGLDDERLSPEMEITIYRIVQEALVNIIRHAQATHADVIVERCLDRVRVIVEDNGRGFETTAAIYSGRLGLLGMRERAEMLGGHLVIDSTPGAGTTVLMEAPYGGSHPDRG